MRLSVSAESEAILALGTNMARPAVHSAKHRFAMPSTLDGMAKNTHILYTGDMRRYLLKFWLPLAIASGIILFAIYAAVQQNYRMSLNDPQIQMAEDGAALLGSGLAPRAIFGNTHTDMSLSLSPFIIVYDDAGKVVASSGYIGTLVPVLPGGVFDYARANRDDRITWQPASSTRIAAVVKHFSGTSPGFIAVGRNMREIENREGQLLLMIGAAWIGLLVLTLIAVLYAWVLEQKSAAGQA